MITFIESNRSLLDPSKFRVEAYVDCSDLSDTTQVEIERLGFTMGYIPGASKGYFVSLGRVSTDGAGATLQRLVNLERRLRSLCDALVAGDAKAIVRMAQVVKGKSEDATDLLDIDVDLSPFDPL